MSRKRRNRKKRKSWSKRRWDKRFGHMVEEYENSSYTNIPLPRIGDILIKKDDMSRWLVVKPLDDLNVRVINTDGEVKMFLGAGVNFHFRRERVKNHGNQGQTD